MDMNHVYLGFADFLIAHFSFAHGSLCLWVEGLLYSKLRSRWNIFKGKPKWEQWKKCDYPKEIAKLVIGTSLVVMYDHKSEVLGRKGQGHYSFEIISIILRS